MLTRHSHSQTAVDCFQSWTPIGLKYYYGGSYGSNLVQYLIAICSKLCVLSHIKMSVMQKYFQNKGELGRHIHYFVLISNGVKNNHSLNPVKNTNNFLCHSGIPTASAFLLIQVHQQTFSFKSPVILNLKDFDGIHS